MLRFPTLFLALALSAVAADKPNILYIMADDHAAHAIGAYGGRLARLDPTPNIDRLADEGMLLQNAFCTNSICAPSRATIITGQYSNVNGVKTLDEGIEPARQYLPRLMKQAGYETAMIGKWHLKEEPAAFDYYAVLPGQGSYFNPVLRIFGNGSWPDNEKRFTAYDSVHSTDAILQLALDWLKGHDRSKPFFLMLHFKAPHDDFENAERYDFLYEDTLIPEPDSLWVQPNYGSEATKGMGTSVGKRNQRRNMGHHMFVDPSLRRHGLQTHGLPALPQEVSADGARRGRCDGKAAHLSRRKWRPRQDSNHLHLRPGLHARRARLHRQALDVRGVDAHALPGALSAGDPAPARGSDAIINNTDFAETILDFAGVPAPDYMQGRSFAPILRGHTPADWRTATYYRYWMHMAHHDNPAHYGIRTKDFKLIFFYGLPLGSSGAHPEPTQPGWELYDLREDPHEMHNVYGQPAYAEIARRLKAELLRMKDEVGDTDEQYPELMEVRRRYWE